jgi:hypothetical protein
MRPASIALGICAAVAALATACASDLSNTGFHGTWVREGLKGDRYVVSIREIDDGYQFGVDQYGVDGHHRLRCKLGSDCAYFEGDRPYYGLKFEAFTEPGDDALYVDCRGFPLDDRSTPIHWVERLTVSPDGLELRARRIELNGVPRTDPERVFAKQSNRVGS